MIDSGDRAEGAGGRSKGFRYREHKGRFVMFSLVPAMVLLLAIEAVLQVVGFPYSYEALRRPLFVEDGQGIVRTDPFFVFEQSAAEAGAIANSFAAAKDEGVLRIAIIGGSSVVLLRECLPMQDMLINAGVAKEVEVINCGICGCGIERVEQSMREVMEYDVDVILIYSGHNEFVDHSKERSYGEVGWLRRNFKLLELAGGPVWVPEPGHLYTDEEKERVYAEFEASLRRIVALAASRGVPLVIGTVAMNLHAPLEVSRREDPDLSEVDRMAGNLHKEGLRLFDEGEYERAGEFLRKAVAASPRPFRATSRINEIIRETAEEGEVPLVDMEAIVNRQVGHRLPGYDWFDDAVHMNLNGSFLFQVMFSQKLARVLGGQPPSS